MARSGFTHLRHRRVIGGPLIPEAELLLHALGFFVSVVIPTPHPGKPQILKGMAEQPLRSVFCALPCGKSIRG